jgi:hypothetical protein
LKISTSTTKKGGHLETAEVLEVQGSPYYGCHTRTINAV